ncbi:MAG TPA: methionyl-tRNA formyltransferase [Candidatus Paceibacterota bacterium]|nr:methionyl-tRNA formyltransferase [Candidatus Paceibacterota bacterium]
MKIIFIGTPQFGAIILEGLARNNYKPVLVITAPDKPVGRKQILTPSEVKKLARKYNIPIIQPQKIENCELEIENLRPDLIISASYGQIIPKEILKIPKYGSLNVHPSLLPKYRGPSPIQQAILNGDKKTGITIYLMDEKIDHGPIISDLQFPISKKFNYQELKKELAELGLKLLLKTIPKWTNDEIKSKPQDESKASYTKIIKKEDGKIDWSKSADEIERQIRAFYPWPGTFTFWNKKRLKILEADVSKPSDNKNYSLGETFFSDKKLLVSCGRNFLIIKKLQLEGKRTTNAEEFLKGHSDFIGAILSN